MTTQHKDCFSLYANAAKFIKSHFTYSCHKHTETPHAGSHRYYEPVNRTPKVGWVSSILPSKLGGVNSGPVHISNCGWVPIRTDNSSLPGPCAPSNKVLTRDHGANNYRGLGTPGQKPIVRTQLTQQSYVFQIFLVEKRDGGRYQ